MPGGQRQLILQYVKVRNGHVAPAKHKAVRARAAGQGIRATATVKRVIANAAVKRVIARAAVEDIIAGAAVQRIITAATVKRVIAEAAVEDVIIGAAVQGVIATATVKRVIAGAAVQLIIAGAAVQFIMAGPAEQPVIAGPAEQLVLALAALQVIVAAKAPHIALGVRVGGMLFGAGVEHIVVIRACQEGFSGIADGGQIAALIKAPAEGAVEDHGLAFFNPQVVQRLDGGRIAGVFRIQIFTALQAVFVVVAGDMKTAVNNLFAQLFTNGLRGQAGAALLFQALNKIAVELDLRNLAA